MSDIGYIRSVLGSLASDIKVAITRAFEEAVDGRLAYGPPDDRRRATNFAAVHHRATTPATANEEFSIAHGLGRKPYVIESVLPLDVVNAQLVPLTVSRAADMNRAYLKSSSTSVAICVRIE